MDPDEIWPHEPSYSGLLSAIHLAARAFKGPVSVNCQTIFPGEISDSKCQTWVIKAYRPAQGVVVYYRGVPASLAVDGCRVTFTAVDGLREAMKPASQP